MVLAGLYVLLFGLAEVLPRYGVYALDPVVRVTTQWQFQVTQAVQSWGTPVLIALVALALGGTLAVLIAARRAARA